MNILFIIYWDSNTYQQYPKSGWIQSTGENIELSKFIQINKKMKNNGYIQIIDGNIHLIR